MTSSVNQLEDKLGDLYKGVPDLPDNARKTLVEWAPWLALLAGLGSLWAAWAIWNLANYTDSLINYSNALSAYYGVPTVSANHWTLALGLGLLALAVEGVLYLAAFPALRARKKSGWDLLFYGVLVNLAYALIALFAYPGDGFVRLIGALLGSAAGFYFLYQVRSYYGGKKAVAKK
jgi:hypothetical protein